MIMSFSSYSFRRLLSRSVRSPSSSIRPGRSFSSTTRTAAAAAAAPKKTALVLGSSGALGSSVSHYLSREMNMQVIGADPFELPNDLDLGWELDAFVRLPEQASVTELSVALYEGVHRVLEEFEHGGVGHNNSLDAIICANGGWQGDPPLPSHRGDDDDDDDDDTLRTARVHEAASVLERMMSVNLHPVLAASLLSSPNVGGCTAPGALVVIIGATAALQPTPGMLGYGVGKAAVHHVVQTMGASSTDSMTKSKKNMSAVSPHHPTVLGILPTTLDTPGNRKAMPDADTSRWTDPRDISRHIGMWLKQPSSRPASGSLVKVRSSFEGDGAAAFELVR